VDKIKIINTGDFNNEGFRKLFICLLKSRVIY